MEQKLITKLCYAGFKEWLNTLEQTGLAELRELVKPEEEAWIARYEEALATWEVEAKEMSACFVSNSIPQIWTSF